MSKSLEKNLWARAYRALRRRRGLHITRIENSADTGTPDVEGCYQAPGWNKGEQFWWELKVGEITKKGTVKVSFRPKQIPWLKKRWKAGGWAYAIIKIEDRIYCIAGCDLGIFQENKDITLEDLDRLCRTGKTIAWIDLIRACVGAE